MFLQPFKFLSWFFTVITYYDCCISSLFRQVADCCSHQGFHQGLAIVQRVEDLGLDFSCFDRAGGATGGKRDAERG